MYRYFTGVKLAAIVLIQLTAPDGQRIDVNPLAIVSMRPPRGTDHFAANANCVLITLDGKFVLVQETCGRIMSLIDHSR
jgi:hypothetical protein